VPDALASARREARAAFGDDTLLVEKYIDAPRHIEVQVLADAHGTVIHLGERECSLQRRHQKVIEEAPSPLLDEARRAAMGTAAVGAARSVGYVGAGTVECIVDGGNPDNFYFMEMNTRLQVEHPVTELITGLDLVEWQIRVAAGEQLGDAVLTARLTGHAIEARVYAEDPARGFLPTGGTVLAYSEPTARVDSGIAEGSIVTSAYDPMLAKVAAWGPDRATALRRLDAALRETTILGVTTNVAFLRALLADPDVQAGRLDTGLIERRMAASPARSWVKNDSVDSVLTRDHGKAVPDAVLAAAALMLLPGGAATAATDPWDIADGWRVGERAWTRLRLSAGPGSATDVRVRGLAATGAQLSPGGANGASPRTPRGAPDEGARISGALVAIGEGEPLPIRGKRSGNALLVEVAEKTLTFGCALDGRTVWLGRDGLAWALTEVPTAGKRGGAAGTADGTVRSPMPGTVLAVRVSAGDAVAAGQPLAVIEAMKMEHTVTAPLAGTVAELPVRAGQQVQMDETLAVIKEASDAAAPRGDERSIPPYPPGAGR
jgi:acetyl-CoA/propionyl-CoA carboxylase, biotin carboxylase, biotin carboxyl carrier protein